MPYYLVSRTQLAQVYIQADTEAEAEIGAIESGLHNHHEDYETEEIPFDEYEEAKNEGLTVW